MSTQPERDEPDAEVTDLPPAQHVGDTDYWLPLPVPEADDGTD